MAAFTSIEQRADIKIFSNRQENARQIHAALEQACGDQALSYSQAARWVVEIKKSWEAIDNRSGRPATMTDGYKIKKEWFIESKKEGKSGIETIKHHT